MIESVGPGKSDDGKPRDLHIGRPSTVNATKNLNPVLFFNQV
jgi:hypothetical protein